MEFLPTIKIFQTIRKLQEFNFLFLHLSVISGKRPYWLKLNAEALLFTTNR